MTKKITTLVAFGLAAGLLVPAFARATTVSGTVTAFSPTSITVLDREAVTVGVDKDTVFTKLTTQKPWQEDTALTAKALRVGNFVVVHVPDSDHFVATWVQVAVGLPTMNSPVLSQDKKPTPDFTIGKKGQIHFNVRVKAGSVVLEPGMYQVQHAVENGEHFIAFKAMEMPAGYRHGNTPVAGEAAARIACKVEATDKKVSRTTIALRTNVNGEKEVAEVQVAGESFKHVL
jgi:hypothetical protein